MGDVVGPVGRDEFLRTKRQSRVAFLVALAAAAVALLAAYGVIRISRILQSSEEPPIRVRNGSQDVIVSFDAWEQDTTNDKKNWHLKSTMRYHPGLDVVFFYQGSTCKGNFAKVNTLKIEYVEGDATNTMDISAPAKKVKVRSKEDLASTSAGDVISYGSSEKGYIRHVFLDNDPNWFCEFSSAQDLGEIRIYNW
jgi:hypothetical protein